MQKRTATITMATIRGMDLVVERQQRQFLSKPGVWEDYAYEVALASANGPIKRYAYPNLGIRGSHFLYKIEDFAVPTTLQGGPEDAACNAAYDRFRIMCREIDIGGKPL